MSLILIGYAMINFNSVKSKLVYVSAYESVDTYLNCTLHLPNENVPLILVLNSHKAINWKINNEFNNKIEAVLINHYGGSSTVEGHGTAPIVSILGLSGVFNDYANALSYLKVTLGKYPSYVKIKRAVSDLKLERVSEHYIASDFKAEYYCRSHYYEGAFPRYCERVDNIALKIDKQRSLYGVPADDFYAIWRGNVEVLARQRCFIFEFKSAAAHVQFYLDGKLISEWCGENKDWELELARGSHQLEIRCISQKQAIDFSVSLSDELMFA